MLAGKVSSSHFDFNTLAKVMWIILIPLILINICWSIPSIYISSLFADYSSMQNKNNLE